MQTKPSSRSSLHILVVFFVTIACLFLIDKKREHPQPRGRVQLIKPPVDLIMDPLILYAPLQSGAFFI